MIGIYNSKYSRYDIIVNSNILNRIAFLQNEITDLTDLILFNNNTIQVTLIDITDAYDKTYLDIFSKLHIK